MHDVEGASGLHFWRRHLLIMTTITISIVLWLTLLFFMDTFSARVMYAAPAREATAFCDTAQGIAISECEALVALYNSTDGTNWFTNTGWLQTTTPCSGWYGITCIGTIVTEITLVSNTLRGTLPSAIGALKNLRRLELRNNHLQGELPTAIEELNSLYALMLTGNQLTGDISTYAWEKFPNMFDLRLDGNQFTGQIPPILGELRELGKLYLGVNELSGSIPDAFGAYCINGVGGMCKLTILDLGRSGISGTLPSSLGNLSMLEFFNILDDDITGSVPIELANWRKIKSIFADGNHLQGELLPFVGMTNLETLRLSGNHFTGTIPTALALLTSLQRLSLQNNQLRGSVPQEVACLEHLKDPHSDGLGNLGLGGNLLTADDSATKDCLANLSPDGDYRRVLGYQVVPPTLLHTGEINDRYVELLWRPVDYGGLIGWYEIAYTQSLTETPQFTARTSDQRDGRFEVRNLMPDTDYYFYVRTFTPATGQQDELYSVPTLQPLRVHTPKTGTHMAVYKEASPLAATPGEEVTYRLTISATEGTVAFSLADTLPLSMTLSENPSGGAQFVNGQILYQGTVVAGAPTIIAYKARIANDAKPGRILQSQALVQLQDADKAEHHIVSAAVVVKGQPTIDTLVLIYTSGNNTLGPRIRELFHKAEAASMPVSMTTFLLYDGPGVDDAYYYRIQHDTQLDEACPDSQNWTCNGRYKLNESMWKWTDEVGAAGSLRDFVSSMMLAHPAKKVILSLVGHGSGWSPNFLGEQPSTHEEQPTNREYGGLLWDEQPDLALSTADLRVALTQAYEKTGQKIDLLYLDACLMAMSEVLYELRGTVDYVLASPGVSWTSFRYDLHLTWPQAPLDPSLIGQRWIENETQELQKGVAYPYFYSLFNLSGGRIEELFAHQDALASALIVALQRDKSTQTRIQTAAAQSACFDTNQDHYIDNKDFNCDLRSFAQQLANAFDAEPRPAPELSETYQTVITAALALNAYLEVGADHFIVTEQHNAARHPRNFQSDPLWEWPDASGLSIYLPIHTTQDEWRRRFYNATFLQSAADGLWDEFIDAYYNTDLPVLPAKCTQCVPVGPEQIITTSLPSMIFLPIVQR